MTTRSPCLPSCLVLGVGWLRRPWVLRACADCPGAYDGSYPYNSSITIKLICKSLYSFLLTMLKINSPLEFPLLFFLDPPPVLCVSFFLWQPFLLFVGHTLKKICVATSQVLTIKILGNFRPTLTFFLRTNHVCFLIRYDTLVLMFLCTILKRSAFSPGK
jgi:hypothetical protein